jgi:hypothetical protein
MNKFGALGKSILQRSMKSLSAERVGLELFPSEPSPFAFAKHGPSAGVFGASANRRRNHKRRRLVCLADQRPIGETTMRKSLSLLLAAGAVLALAACSSSTEEKAGAGAVGGAIVGGPVGAAVGGAAGAVAGHVQDDSSKPHS